MRPTVTRWTHYHGIHPKLANMLCGDFGKRAIELGHTDRTKPLKLSWETKYQFQESLYFPGEFDEKDVYLAKRGDRQYFSRMLPREKYPAKPTNFITMVAGPRYGMFMLYTIYGGKGEALPEPGSPGLVGKPIEFELAQKFWSRHALAVDGS